ncbi:MAG: sulfatase-like hydrolase/transferase [Verrucomicrobiota bacterium JB025]|nr:sulfatase-like hydrolase/transferase [Verrucomicrobiota bacterium JB025]
MLLFCCADVHAGDPTRVACVGDSITYGFGIEKRKALSYPAQLQGLLGDQWIVGNFGKNGATVLKKGHAPYWKAPQFRAAKKFLPDVVIIKLGTNDSRPQNWPQHKSDYVADYVDLIRGFQNLASKPTVWICTPAPVYPGAAVRKNRFSDTVIREEVIPLVHKVAEEAGVGVIDLQSALSDQAWFSDGVHPNARGAHVIAKTVAEALSADHERKRKPTDPVVSESDEKKPNFVIILTDDQGYQDLGCYGSPNIKTPHIDRMAAEGMKFTSFYAQTVCGPSRASLLTGSYPMRTERDPGDDGLMPHPALSLNEVTIAEILKPLGYRTAMIGKWDLSGRQKAFNVDLHPGNQGFDESFWTENSRDGAIRKGARMAIKKPDRSALTRLYTDKAIDFVERSKDQPFFLYLAHVMPHTKLAVSREFKGKSKAGLYGDVIEELDFNVGRLLTRIKELGLDENTWVIFTSDNGPWWIQGPHAGHCEPLRSAKTSTYEGGLRVPFIVRAPGKVPAGKTCDLVCANIDLLPTIAKLSGAKVPGDRVIDGLDISGIFRGSQVVLNRPYFYYQHQALRAVRLGDWKLHLPHSALDRTKEGKQWQSHVPPADRPYIEELTLYNLKDDIGETTNVAKAHPEIVDQLMKQIVFAKHDIGYHDVKGRNTRRK